MGFFDRAKQLLGLGAAKDDDDDAGEEHAEATRPAPRGGGGPKGRDRKDRPPLLDIAPPQMQGVDDVLGAREAGDRAEARKLLAQIDRGQGLRTVLRAAAALEDGDEAEVKSLLGAVANEAEGWKLGLQIAAALGDPAEAAPWVERALAAKAPAWAISWTRAVSADEKERREGLVELLFSDAPLARTVAARDLGVKEIAADSESAQRYAAFAHGRDSIRRFDAKVVAKLVSRAIGGGR